MNSHVCITLLVLFGAVLGLAGQEKELPSNHILFAKKTYIAGEKVKGLVVMQRTDRGPYLGLLDDGMCNGVAIRVERPDKKRFSTEPVHNDIEAFLDKRRILVLKEVRSMVYPVDLSAYGDMNLPGKYSVQLRVRGEKVVLHQAELKMVEFKTPEKKQTVTGLCMTRASRSATSPQEAGILAKLVKYVGESGMWAECSVGLGNATLEDGEQSFLAIGPAAVQISLPDKKKGKKIGWRSTVTYIRVPKNTTLKKAILDFKGQLWTQVECDGKNAVFMVDLHNGTQRQLLSWTGAKIRLDWASTSKRNPHSRYVILVEGDKLRWTTCILPGDEKLLEAAKALGAAERK